MKTYGNAINAGDLSLNSRTRFLVEFFTHNEIAIVFDTDISGNNDI
jgi:hypothetical protein